MTRSTFVFSLLLVSAGCTAGVEGCPDCRPASAELDQIAGRSYLIHRLTFPRSENGDPSTAVGLDLDGSDSGDGSELFDARCDELHSDYLSEFGFSGVDSAGQELITTAESLVRDGSTFTEALENAVADGRIQWAVRLEPRVDGASGMGMELYVVDGAIGRDASGVPTNGQTLRAHRIASTEGFIRESAVWGFVTEETGMEVAGDDVFLLPFDDFRLGGWLVEAQADPGVVRGQIAGSFSVDALVARAVELDGSSDEWLAGTVRSIFESVSDLDPNPADPDICDSISVGFAFDAIEVELAD